MRLLLVDNRDSFSFNLADACRAGGAAVEVVRNSIAPVDALARAEAIVISPGPGAPAEAGTSLAIIAAARGRVPLIGICLGHQALVAQGGGRVERTLRPCHGRASWITHHGGGAFAGLPSPMAVGRYHSLCTPLDGLPARFAVDAALEGMAMAVRDDAAMQLGLQFHPESILTPHGDALVAGMLGWARAVAGAAGEAA